MPEGETSSDCRTVDIGSELLQPLQQRRATGEARDRLDQSGERIPFHCESEADDGLAGHHAVGIENNKALVAAAEALDPILDVPSLARSVVAAAPIETEMVPARRCFSSR